MKNKTLFAILLVIAISITATSALAQEMFPMVVYGEVDINNAIANGRPVEITDINLNHMWTIYTHQDGKFSATLNNYKDDIGRYITSGHTIQIDVCNYKLDSSCRKTVQASTTPTEINFDIDVTDDAIPEIKCPLCVCDICEDCPEDEDGLDWMTALIGTLIGLGVGGTSTYFLKKKEAINSGNGLKFYKKRDGTTAIYHKHPGTTGYHDPNVRHQDEDERHLKGELNPQYEKEDGEWYYVE